MTKEFERERRLEPGEEERLVTACGPHLHDVAVGALETGCRLNELLGLQWRNVRRELNELHFSARTTKAGRSRDLPMATAQSDAPSADNPMQ
jgi:integrase